MFEFVRKHNKVMQIMLFLLIFPSFVLFGLEGYSRFGDKGAAVARIDGQDITQAEWDQAHKAEVERLRAQMPALDPKLLDSPEAHYATLERMVRDRVLAAAAEKSKLATSDARLARDLHENPTIAQLRKPDGTLDMERYRQLVGAQGMTPEMFEARVRNDLSIRQVASGITGTSFASNIEADIALAAYFQRREVQVARFDTADYAGKVNPTDAQLESFYKENAALFQAPEQAVIEYVTLDNDAVSKGLSVSEADLKTYHEQNAQRLSGQEERRASHILIESPKTAGADARAKAKARAEEVLAQVRKAPDSFADLAKKNSQDSGSAANGGDLDFFPRGAMVKQFEDAAFALKKGDISGVVESDFGYHIIKLTDVKLPKQRSFEEMRPEIEKELRKQQAQRKYAESAESFTNLVYEQSDSLKPAADRLKLEVKSATVTRKPAPDAKGPLANARFLNAVFSPDAIEKKRNTEAVETGSSQLTSGRIVKYTASHNIPFAEVKERVRERVLAVRGAEMARKEGMQKLAEWKANPAAASLPAAVVISRDKPEKLPQPVVDAALRADASAPPAFVGADLGALGYAVVKVVRVVPREAAAPEALKQDRAQYAQWWGSAENAAYYNLLKERFKVQIKVAKPASKTDDTQTASR